MLLIQPATAAANVTTAAANVTAAAATAANVAAATANSSALATAAATAAVNAAATAHGTSQVVIEIQFSHSFVCLLPRTEAFIHCIVNVRELSNVCGSQTAQVVLLSSVVN